VYQLVIDKNAVNAMAIEEMVNTQGWLLISRWIDDQIKLAVDKLVVVKFGSIEDVVRLQARIDAFKNLKATINNLIASKED
jgi:hypothetical protein